MDEQLFILKKFPYLVPQNGQFTVFDGYVVVGDKEFNVSLRVPKYPQLDNLQVNLPWNVKVCLEHSSREVDKWKGNCTSLLTFLECLQSEVEESLKTEFATLLFKSGDRMPVDFCERLVDSIACIEAENIRSISTNLERIELYALDASLEHREHHLMIQYSRADPNSPPRIHADIPAHGMKKLEMAKVKSLIEVFQAFKAVILSFSDFWDVMDEMDQKCWVILPEQPRRCDTFRRLALGQHVSLVVTLDPSDVQKLPELNLFGPEQVVEQLVGMMQTNVSRWPAGRSFVDSLRLLLGIDGFPSNPGKGTGSCDVDTDMECMICCSVVLAGETPTEACGNRCGAVYHTVCITQWLVAIAPSDSSLAIQGKCPSCNTGIVKVSNVKH